MNKTETRKRNKWYALALNVEEATSLEELAFNAGFSEASNLYNFLRRNGEELMNKYGKLPFTNLAFSSKTLRQYMEED